MRKKTSNLVFFNENFSFVKFIHNYIYNQNHIKIINYHNIKKIINLVFSIITNKQIKGKKYTLKSVKLSMCNKTKKN